MEQLFALGNTSNNDILGFDSKLLFLGTEIIAPILTKFYNASLTNKIVISDWKVSKVTPIYKGRGNKEEAGNHRPMIGHIMKIFEKEIKTQLMVFLKKMTLSQLTSQPICSNTIHRLHCTVLSMIGSVICQTEI